MSTPFCIPLSVGTGTTDVRPIRRMDALDVHSLAQFLRESAGIPKGQWYWLSADLSDGRRRRESVERVYALVIDVDEGMSLSEGRYRVQELGHPCVLYTTPSHQKQKDNKPACDRFRLVFPLSRAVTGKSWAKFYPSLCAYVGAKADPACKDPSRLWYAALDREGVEVMCEDGALLDPGLVPIIDNREPDKKPAENVGRPSGELKPGDDFARRHSTREVAEMCGWRLLKMAGAEELYVKPGDSGSEHQMTGNYRSGGGFWVFTPLVPGLKENTGYTKMGLYAATFHNGDHSAAAKDLGAKGYGNPARSTKQKHASPAPVVGQVEPPPPESQNGHVDLPDEPIKFDPSDVGNAERFVRLYGSDLRHCHLWGSWLLWRPGRWEADETGGAPIVRKVTQMVRGIAKDAFRPENAGKMAEMLKWAGSCHSKARIESCIGLAKAQDGIDITPALLDADPYLLNLANGTFDLREMRLREHRKTDLLTKIVKHAYSQDAKCLHWLEFLAKVLDRDDELIRYVQKAVGYSLSGDTSEKCFFFLYGLGNNGKSIFVETISRLMGDYANILDVEALMMQQHGNPSGPSSDLAILKGARFVISSETEDGRRLSESKIKRLTGGDTIHCRFLKQEFFSYVPEFKIWIAGNHKPQIRGTDEGIWSRVHLIPFEVTIPKDQRIPAAKLHAMFRTESEGILAWMIEGYRLWQQEGLRKPGAVEQATESYRSESDVFGQFLAECTDADQFGEVRALELYNVYARWAKGQGEKSPATNTRFGRAMSERGESWRQSGCGKMYTGRTIKEEWIQQYSTPYQDT
jgi:putative DNA primase/helicase